MKETFLLGEEDLGTLAEKVMEILLPKKVEKNEATVILLEGGLGAGKTTFTKALAEKLGINKEEVHSPTFILKKEYTGKPDMWRRLVHIDAYRFVHPDEARVLRLEEDLKDPDALIAIEWPSKMTYLKSDMDIEFQVEDEHTRHITLSYEKDN